MRRLCGSQHGLTFSPFRLNFVLKGAGKPAPFFFEGPMVFPYSIDTRSGWLQYCATMKTATVRDLRNRYTSVLRWVSAGEDVLITQRGRVIARLIPETAESAQSVDWASSPEVLKNRSGDQVLSAEQSAEILAEAGGKW